MGNSILDYTDTIQNIKHLFSVGTIIAISKGSFNANFEYKTVEWHRDLGTTWLIKDIYVERTFVLSLSFVHPFKLPNPLIEDTRRRRL